ncbi:MAG: SMP-30/gluconolactonase/LRE family protein [Bacteroidota bacterium]
MKKTIIFFNFLLIGLISCQNNTDQNNLEVIAGTGNPGFKDGDSAELFKPIRLSPYKNNSLVFADINNHAIRIVNENGEVKTIAGGPEKKGFADGNADTAKFNSPHGVAYNSKTNKIYVASASNHVIREISETETGEFIVSTVAGISETEGYKDGSIDSALFNSPHGVLVREDGALVIIDIGNAKLRLIKDGIVSTLAGTSDDDPIKVGFYYPIDISFDNNQNILIADAGNHKIFRVKPGVSADEIILNDTLNTPHGITIDNAGKIYIADMGTNRILAIDKEGAVNTIIDVPADSTNVNNLKKPAAVLYDKGYLWIADLNNHQLKRIKIE